MEIRKGKEIEIRKRGEKFVLNTAGGTTEKSCMELSDFLN